MEEILESSLCLIIQRLAQLLHNKWCDGVTRTAVIQISHQVNERAVRTNAGEEETTM